MKNSIKDQVKEGYEILRLLGGDTFLIMTGSNDLIPLENGLKMSLDRNYSTCNRLDIVKDEDGTFRMVFYKITKSLERKDMGIYNLKGVSGNKLQEEFTRVTKLYTFI